MTRTNEVRRIRAFTLIEMLVVVVIVVLLIGAVIAVGSQVRANATRRATVAQLHTLQELMKDYLAAGNPEPQVPFLPDAESANNWPYGTKTDGGFRLFGYVHFYRTTPASDPYNWVIALSSVPDIAKKLERFPAGDDSAVPRMEATPVTHKLILDSYGTHIRYIPSDPATRKQGYFVSAGPDSKWSIMVRNNSKTPPASTGSYRESGSADVVLRADEIYSTDPQ
jgi:type II secretory pathway pseudopilin PulG